jgi:hypothetical protein
MPLAQQTGVTINTYKVIYNLIDDVKAAMEGKLRAVEEKQQLGEATVSCHCCHQSALPSATRRDHLGSRHPNSPFHSRQSVLNHPLLSCSSTRICVTVTTEGSCLAH